MFLCIYIYIYICLVVPVCIRCALRIDCDPELRGIDGPALGTKCSGSSSSTGLKTPSICLVKASVL
jgi:hypothetical protein